jgi:hypothetical protein
LVVGAPNSSTVGLTDISEEKYTVIITSIVRGFLISL